MQGRSTGRITLSGMIVAMALAIAGPASAAWIAQPSPVITTEQGPAPKV